MVTNGNEKMLPTINESARKLANIVRAWREQQAAREMMANLPAQDGLRLLEDFLQRRKQGDGDDKL